MTHPVALPGIWAISADWLPRVRAAFEDAHLRGYDEDGERRCGATTASPSLPYAIVGETALIPIRGVLHSDAASWIAVFFEGGTRYGAIIETVAAAIRDDNIKQIRLDIDSPGGDVNGCYEAAEAIREMGRKKPIDVYVSGICASAAYWLASACRSIEASPSSAIGSIGVYCEMYDETGWLAQHGVKRIVVASEQTPRKHPDLAAEDGTVDIQAQVNDICEVFFERVALGRNVDREHVAERMGRGACLVGARALEAKLIDALSGVVAAVPPQEEQTMESCEPQCRALVASAQACLAVLDTADEAHGACIAACETTITAAEACIDAGAKPGSPEALACAETADACKAECDQLDMPECRACAASCESAANACRSAAEGSEEEDAEEAAAADAPPAEQAAATTTQNAGAAGAKSPPGAARAHTQEVKRMGTTPNRAANPTAKDEEIAQLREQLNAERAKGATTAAKLEGVESYVGGLKMTAAKAGAAAMLAKHAERGAITAGAKKDFAADLKEAEAQGADALNAEVAKLDKTLSRLADGTARPLGVGGKNSARPAPDDDAPESVIDDVHALAKEQGISVAQAHRLVARKNGERYMAAVRPEGGAR